MHQEFTAIEPWQYALCLDLDLYCRNQEYAFFVYKPAGVPLMTKVIRPEKLPQLYILKQCQENLTRSSHQALAEKLKYCLKSGTPQQMKEMLLFTMNQLLSEPRGGNLRLCFDAAGKLVQTCLQEANGIKNLQLICTSGQTTALHSVSVMAFTLGLCKFRGHDGPELERIGLASLLHDIGKSQVSRKLLEAPRVLNPEEKKELEQHVNLGCEILRDSSNGMAKIYPLVAEHHEKLDGSGYPNGLQEISEGGQVMAVVDIYDALTNDRPYRESLEPQKALRIIKCQAHAGKLSHSVYRSLLLALDASNFE